MRRHRHRFEDSLDLAGIESVGLQALAGAAGNQLLRTRACGDALGGHPDQAPSAELGGHGEAVQRVQLLGLDARDRRRLVLGEPRFNADLGTPCALTAAHQLGDVLGQRLGLEGRVAEHDLTDRLVDHLLKARHVRALLVGPELDHALKAC